MEPAFGGRIDVLAIAILVGLDSAFGKEVSGLSPIGISK
jgi:hypothetical protein